MVGSADQQGLSFKRNRQPRKMDLSRSTIIPTHSPTKIQIKIEGLAPVGKYSNNEMKQRKNKRTKKSEWLKLESACS